MEQEEIIPPKVFVSHASEDKDRFVRGFAKKLRDNGIEAWVDEWEIRPGDSLVNKIFDVGIGGAQAILIILSQTSVEKPWVREELDASFIEKIKRGIKIIPIVLDDCAVPIPLQATLYVRIHNLSNYEAELNSIVNAIYEYSDKPPLGTPPPYVQTPLQRIPGLRKTDSLILQLAGEKAIKNGGRLIETTDILSEAASLSISRYDFFESLTVLGDKRYFELNRVMAGEPTEPELRRITRGGVPDFSITIFGFEQYANSYIPNYSSITRDVLLQIANYDKSDDASIASALKQPLMLIDHILDILDQRGLITIIREFGDLTQFYNPSPEIKRILEDF